MMKHLTTAALCIPFLAFVGCGDGGNAGEDNNNDPDEMNPTDPVDPPDNKDPVDEPTGPTEPTEPTEPPCDPETHPMGEFGCRTDCLPKRAGDPEEAVCIHEVTGSVVDENGDPVDDLGVTVCGNSCYPGDTDENGDFAIRIYEWHLPGEYSASPHGSPDFSTFYYQLDPEFAGGSSYDSGTLHILPLPADGATLIHRSDLEDGATPPAQVVTSGPVTLEIAEGTLPELVFGDIAKGEEGARFRALEIEKSRHSDFSDQLEANDRAFALGPFDASFSSESEPSVTVKIDNTENWPAGSMVEVLALGTYYNPDWVTPHTFGPIGTATVSEDASVVVLDGDQAGLGLEHLTWLVLRP